jgi:hypothetical protein
MRTDCTTSSAVLLESMCELLAYPQRVYASCERSQQLLQVVAAPVVQVCMCVVYAEGGLHYHTTDAEFR